MIGTKNQVKSEVITDEATLGKNENNQKSKIKQENEVIIKRPDTQMNIKTLEKFRFVPYHLWKETRHTSICIRNSIIERS